VPKTRRHVRPQANSEIRTNRTKVRQRPVVRLAIPKEELFVGSFHRILVVVTPAAKVKFDDLRFEIPAGASAGLISLSRDRLFNPKKPHIMLLVGFKPGTYVLNAVNTKTNKILATAKFTVGTLWANEDIGPTRWFTGIVGNYNAGSSWGGGPAGPQNVNVAPALGTRRIAILLVDTSSQRFTMNASDLQNHRDRWLNAIVNGVTDGGVTTSCFVSRNRWMGRLGKARGHMRRLAIGDHTRQRKATKITASYRCPTTGTLLTHASFTRHSLMNLATILD
jgi:hypothetical protein